MSDRFEPACVVQRYAGNPVLSAKDVPYASEDGLIFNAGVARFGGRYRMVFRCDNFVRRPKLRSLGTTLGLASSDDGIHWQVEPKPVFSMETDEILRAYDPRLTVLDGRCYMCFAVDTRHGVCGAVAVTDDLKNFEVLSMSAPDNRNMVLFPQRIGGKLVRLERPFPVYSRGEMEAFDIWLSDSPDGRYWGNTHLVLGREQVPWCNNKIGPAAPPIRTDKGWLALIHVVDKDDARPLPGWEENPWRKRYSAGVMLLDAEQPWRVLGLSRRPVLMPAPQYPYEWEGFRGGVIFPGGLIDEGDGTVKIYYGAADTVECLATAKIADLLALCEAV